MFPAFAALHIVVREQNAQVPRILQWRINSLPRFHEVMSQVFENAEVSSVYNTNVMLLIQIIGLIMCFLSL